MSYALKAILISLAMLFTQGSLYPRAMQVVEFETETDTVVCVDATGLEWAFYGIEDWEIGDLVVCIMDTNETDVITDDSIVEIRYSGYTFPLNKYGMFDMIVDN